MTTETPTAEPFDTFEQRLVAALGAEAETVVEPADGLDRIRGRVAHRRRTRRATWLAAAAALVLIAGTVGVLLRSSSTDSAPYVGTDSTGDMPLLGFTDGGGRLFQYAPGMSYLVIASGDRPATDGRYLQLIHQDADLGPGSFAWSGEETVTLDDRQVQIGTQTTNDGIGNVSTSRAVWWDGGHGWRVTVTTGYSGDGPTRDDLLAAAAAVVQVPQDRWERGVDDGPSPSRPFDEPNLVLAPEAGGTQVIGMSANSVTTWLTPRSEDLPDVMLGAIPAAGVGDQLAVPDVVDVRGVQGRFSAGEGSARPFLSWIEDGQGYEISAEAGASAEQLVRIAELLVMPDADAWHALVFPDGAKNFPDSAFFRVEPTPSSGP